MMKKIYLMMFMSFVCIGISAQTNALTERQNLSDSIILQTVYEWTGRQKTISVKVHSEMRGQVVFDPITGNTTSSSFSTIEGFVDEEGTVIVPDSNSIMYAQEDRVIFANQGKYGYANMDGEIIIPCQYQKVGSFHEGLACVQDFDRKWYYVDKMGEKVIALPSNCGEALWFSDGLAPVKIAWKWGYINKTGYIIIKNKYDAARPFSEHRAFVAKAGDYWVCIDEFGKQQFKCRTQKYYDFDDLFLNRVNREKFFPSFHYGVAKFALVKHYYNGAGIYIGPKEGGPYRLIEMIESVNVYADSDMLMKIGNMYYWGVSAGEDEFYPELEVQQNFVKAFEWYLKAANKNNSRARFMIGWMYQHGQGVMPNIDEAIIYYKKSNEPEAKQVLNAWLYISNNELSPQTVIASDRDPKIEKEQGIIVPPRGATRRQKRVALVIGNGDYNHPKEWDPLPCSIVDADSIADKLEMLGFKVMTVRNATRKELNDSINKFVDSIKSDEMALVYYSGHGTEIGNANYLIPIEFKDRMYLNIDDIVKNYSDSCIVVNNIMTKLNSATDSLKLFVLDCCRTKPYNEKGTKVKTPDAFEFDENMCVIYATPSGEKLVTYQDNKKNSPFTSAFLEALDMRLTLTKTFEVVKHKLEERKAPSPQASPKELSSFQF